MSHESKATKSVRLVDEVSTLSANPADHNDKVLWNLDSKTADDTSCADTVSGILKLPVGVGEEIYTEMEMSSDIAFTLLLEMTRHSAHFRAENELM